MRRKDRTKEVEPDDALRTAATSSTDHDAFWDGAPTDDPEHLETLAEVIETDEQQAADETLEYMGAVPRTKIEPDELAALADWAEGQACRACRKQILETHDPMTLKHPNCRAALRVERLLRRYT